MKSFPPAQFMLRLALLSSFLFGFSFIGSVPVVHAAPQVVTNLNDSGIGSLRQAILDAAPGDTITFNVSGTISLASELVISKNLIITGPGPSNLIISGGLASRVIDNSVNLTLSGLTIQDGVVAAGNGGGILNTGVLSLTGSVVSNNKASLGGGIYNDGGVMHIYAATIRANRGDMGEGGGVYNSWPGQLTMANSTVSGNSSESNGGGVFSAGITSLVNTTISGNTSVADAVIVFGGTLSLNNVTINANTAKKISGGLRVLAGSASMQNTIIAMNTAGLPDCVGLIASGGHNLVGNISGCNFPPAAGDITGTSASPLDPKLSPLQDNGGPTLTSAPLVGSEVVDAGSPVAPGSGGSACVNVDQRGAPRPIDGDGNGSAICDIGAVERTTGATVAASSSSPTLLGQPTLFTAFTPGSGVIYQWNFGDGVTASGGLVSHTYALAGVYSAAVTSSGSLGTSSAAVLVTIDNPLPVIKNLQPGLATIGSPGLVLTVIGSGFSASTLYVNGSPRPTHLVDGQMLTADIPASDLAVSGLLTVTVSNPAPGGGMSNGLTLIVDPPLLNRLFIPIIVR